MIIEPTYNYSTDLIELAPGDEKLLGKDIVEKKDDSADTSAIGLFIEIFQPTVEQIKESKNRKKKRSANENKSSSDNFDQAFDDAVRNEFDTVVNGQPMMYRYVENTVAKAQNSPFHKIHYSFEITGQVKLKK